jgi:hypothetical protein
MDSNETKTGALSVDELMQITREIRNQPDWRTQADKEADYADGNQLSSELLTRLKAAGMPPAKENIITPAIAALCGYEAKTRTDWRVSADGEAGSRDMADAMNYKLNQAERHSKADKALSRAFRAMVTVGVGFVEVARAANSLDFGFKCRYVHRNEIWWDLRSTEPDFSDARWLRRRRWIDKDLAAQTFPEHAELLRHGYAGWFDLMAEAGDMSTGLMSADEAERAWTKTEDAWHNTENRTVAIDEVWYRRWERVKMMRIKGGRSVRYSETNAAHVAALMAGKVVLVEEVIPTVRRSYWVGAHMLHDSASPYPHQHFPYVPVIGYREDMTGVPYGLVRDMVFPQDNLNSTISKLRWGIASAKTVRTKGVLAMTDDQFRRTISRVDADIVLDPQALQQGGKFEVSRDFQLNAQQFQLMNDSRQAVQRVSGVSASFMGQAGSATSGLQEQTQLEQSQVSIADLMDNFHEARTMVGEMLMALIIEDIGEEEQTIIIDGDSMQPARTVKINVQEIDPQTGRAYLNNDISNARLKVSLDDVPTSSGFRAQQLNALTEAVKSAPAQLQQVILPFMVNLMDLPKKERVLEAIQQATAQPDPEQAKEQAKQELMHDLKSRELDLRERELAAKEKLMAAETVQTGVQTSFSAMQAGAQVAQMPQIAPIADTVMQLAGYQKPAPFGQDPNFPAPEQAAARNVRSPYIEGQGAQLGSEQEGALQVEQVRQNTHPTFPPLPQESAAGTQGMDTPSVADNLPE